MRHCNGSVTQHRGGGRGSRRPYFAPLPDPLLDESLLLAGASLSVELPPVRSLRIATGVNDVVTWSRSSSCSVESTPVMLS